MVKFLGIWARIKGTRVTAHLAVSVEDSVAGAANPSLSCPPPSPLPLCCCMRSALLVDVGHRLPPW